MDSTSDARIVIDRLHCRFNMPHAAHDMQAKRDLLAATAAGRLSDACRQALPSLADAGEAVYRIRKLHLDLWVDMQGMSEAEIARRWGDLLAKAIMRGVRQGGQSVVRFASPLHFAASFVRDLLDGRAWGCWYYAEFLPLQRLPPEKIAMQFLSVRPQWIAPMFAELDKSGHGERLLAQFDPEDVAQLFRALGLPVKAGQFMLLPRVIAGLEQIATVFASAAVPKTPDGASRARARFRLWLALMARDKIAAEKPETVNLLHMLVDLAALARGHQELAPVLKMASGLYPAAIQKLADGPLQDMVEWLAPMSATPEGREILARLTEVAAVSPSGTRARAESFTSPAGGVFLLLPALTELGFWSLWREFEGEERARDYIFAVALKTLGRERAPMILSDPALAALAGLKEAPVADARYLLEAKENQLDPERAWLSSLPRRRSFAKRGCTLAVAKQVLILRDNEAGVWLAAAPAGRGTDAAHPPESWRALIEAAGAVRTELSDDALQQLAAEAAHFQLGARLGFAWLNPAVDAALSVAASMALRATSARLRGFANASPGYFARQFLAQPATFFEDKEKLVVKLSGGPLAVVLSMANFPQKIAAPWLSREVHLRLPGM